MRYCREVALEGCQERGIPTSCLGLNYKPSSVIESLLSCTVASKVPRFLSVFPLQEQSSQTAPAPGLSLLLWDSSAPQFLMCNMGITLGSTSSGLLVFYVYEEWEESLAHEFVITVTVAIASLLQGASLQRKLEFSKSQVSRWSPGEAKVCWFRVGAL